MHRRYVAAALAGCLAVAGCTTTGSRQVAAPPSAPATGRATSTTVRDVPAAMLVWTPGRLPGGFARRVGGLPGVRHSVVVVSGTVWLTRSLDGRGRVVDRPPAGMAIPLDLAAAAPDALAPFLAAADRHLLARLERGEAILGTTSARLRRLGAGGRLEIGAPPRPGRVLRVAGVLPDKDVGAHELLVSREQAAVLGQTTDRYLLVQPARGTRWQALAARIRATLPPGMPVRIRGPGQATWLRQGDAVLPQAVQKALLGEFAADPRPAPGGWVTIDPAWVRRHVVTAAVPILGRVTCNKAIIPQLRGALGEIARRGLAHLVDPADYAGCYAPRVIAGDPGPSLAHHAWGSALDLNVTANPLGARSRQDPRLVAAFERWGFTWGGNWLIPDAMHFELLRRPPRAARAQAP